MKKTAEQSNTFLNNQLYLLKHHASTAANSPQISKLFLINSFNAG